MKFSNLFFYNNFFERNHSNFELIDLMRKSCLIHQDSSGVFSWLSLGLILRKKVEAIIQEEMDNIDFSQIELSLLQEQKLWEKTDRVNSYGGELFQVKNRKNSNFLLSATCEESITNIVINHYNKSSNMNINVYQIGNKYRDELRARSGLIRAKEFVMKDGYSFCNTEQQLEEIYQEVKKAYCRIFDRLNLKYEIIKTDNGEIGGKSSEEFHCISEYGEDNGEQKTLEIAHIFNLGQEYSSKMGLMNNLNEFIHMGCFGIGVSRLIMALLEQQRDQFGFWGSDSFYTFDYVISAIDYNKHKEYALEVYQFLKGKGYSVLLDDRDIQAGKKMADSELIGCKKRIVISTQSLKNNLIEILNRKTMEKVFVDNNNLELLLF